MRKVLGIGVLAMSWAAFVMPATAADGWYVSANAGGSTLLDADFKDVFPVLGVSVSANGETEYDTGYGISGSIGRYWGKFRLEGEISYRQNDLDKLTITSLGAAGVLVTGVAAFDLGGDISSLGFMVNAYRDFDAGGNWAPFVMAGIGGANINLDATSIGGVAVTYDESDTVIAYQVGAGVGYKFSPKTSVNLSYRFLGTSDPTFDDGVDVIDSEYYSHNLWVGITQKF